MLTALPWQLNILVGEALLSMVIAMWLAERGSYQRTPERAIALAICDATCIGLMVWAGGSSWQHVLYVVMYLWAIYAGLTKGFKRTKEEFKPEHATILQVTVGVMALGIIALIATG